MDPVLNKFYRNHNLLYKIFLFAATTFLIVYLFPKSGTFRYSFEKGKPWQSENLYAPFDFAIQKSGLELEKERQQISKESPVFFEVDTAKLRQISNNYKTVFERSFFEVTNQKLNDTLFQFGRNILSELYATGLLSESYNFDNEQIISVLIDNTQSKTVAYNQFFIQTDLKPFITSKIEASEYIEFLPAYLSLFFDVVEPNASYNSSLSESALKERVGRIVPVRGRVDKGTLIISKGEVVQGDKLSVLKSLESEYESQVWTEANYVWILVAYTVLVALALLMLLLFLRKYREDIFTNNTKVTFIFFNITLMVLLTTLVVNYNSAYVYAVPLCILPLVLKAFLMLD